MTDAQQGRLKFRAAAGFRLPALPGTPLEPRRYSSTYHDTPDHRLASAGVALRYRSENGYGAWQLRLPANGSWIELELPGSPDRVPRRFRDLVTATLRDRRTSEVATLDTMRRGVRVERSGRVVAEVTVDQVVVRAGEESVRAFDEVEVDLIEGGERDLRRIGRRLHEAGAVDGDQQPKLLRALGLAQSDPPRVDPKAPPRRQLAAMLQIQYHAILAHDPGTRLGADPEELHQHRVAVRRLRALLRAARPMIDREWADELRDQLRWLGSTLGEVRDLDVLLEHLEDEAAELEPDDAQAFAPVVAVLANRREAARALMLAELRDPRYIRLLERLERDLAYPPEAGEAVKPRAIAAAEFRGLRKARRRLGSDPEDHELHELRIKVKRARYAAELAMPSRGAKARRFVKHAKRLQDLLGDHQDSVVAAERLRELAVATGDPRAALAAGLVVARQAERREAAREAFPEAWRALKRSGKRAWL